MTRITLRPIRSLNLCYRPGPSGTPPVPGGELLLL